MRRRSVEAGCRLTVTAVAMTILLAGCSVVSGDPATPSRLSGAGAVEGGSSFPNLRSVPDAPPPTSSPEARRAVTEGLQFDRSKADYIGAAPTEGPSEMLEPGDVAD